MKRLCAVLLLGLLPMSLVAQPVRIGVLAPDGSRGDILRNWSGLPEYLQAALPDLDIEVVSLDIDGLRQAVAGGRVDFFLANSGFFVEAEVAYGASALATVTAQDAESPNSALGSAVVVPAHRLDLQKLSDLRGKRVVAVHRRAFGGYQIGLHALWKAGVEVEDLAAMSFTGFPAEKMLLELGRNRADAAIMRLCLLEQLNATPQFSQRRYRVLGQMAVAPGECARSTEMYADWPFARLKHTDPVLTKQLTLALLAMPVSATGFAWTVPSDYSRVHQLFRDLRIGPYEYRREETVGILLRRHWPWLLLPPVLLLGFLAHTLRAERLVQRRTSELRIALAEGEKLAREARERDAQLERLARLGALGEMSTMIAHELNQPLAAIGNFARGMVRRVEGGRCEPGPLLEAGNEIAEQAERAGAVIQRVRSLAKRRTYERRTVALVDLIEQSVDTFCGARPGAPRPQVRFQGDRHALLHVDATQIEELLLNLLSNGFEAMQNVPVERRTLRIEANVAADSVQVSVIDAGIGLPEAGRDQLYEPFFTTKPDGVGLGLAICKRAVEAHGGRLEAFDNAPLPGARMVFTLPRVASLAQENGAAGESEADTTAGSARVRYA